MFNIFKKKKKNIIAERIKNLRDKFWFIYLARRNYDIENRIRFCRGDFSMKSENYKIASLNTAYGKRRLAVGMNSLYYGKEDLIKNTEFEKSVWSFNFNYFFSIKVRNDDVFVSVSPDINLTKEDIDLAILEFENVAEEICQKEIDREKAHEELIKFLKEGS